MYEEKITYPRFTRTTADDILFTNSFYSTVVYDTKHKGDTPKIMCITYNIRDLMKMLDGIDDMTKALLRLYRDDLELSDFDLEDEE